MWGFFFPFKLNTKAVHENFNGRFSPFYSGWLDEQYVIQIMMNKLKTKPCRNQGFVLDGFPKTYNQAKELFHGRTNNLIIAMLEVFYSVLMLFVICIAQSWLIKLKMSGHKSPHTTRKSPQVCSFIGM